MLELQVCEVYRIPHSHFLGGPPVWTQTDRDKAIWHQIHKRQTCPSCGTHPDDWDPDKGGDLNAWVAGEHHCKGCQRLQVAQERTDKRAERGDKPLKGTTITLQRPKEARSRA